MTRITALLFLLASAATCFAYPVEVISPNGGEIWQAGTTQTITWDFEFASSVTHVELYKDGQLMKYLGHTSHGEEYLDWKICEDYAPDGGYTIRIYTDYHPGPDEDFSDAPFSIANDSYPDITVTCPNGGEVWPAGSPQTITWQSANTNGYVEVRLYKDGQLQQILGQAMLTDGAFAWTTPNWSDDSADYSIGVRWLTTCGPAVNEDMSDAPFAIIGSTAKPTLDLTYPTGSETFYTDSIQTITWHATNPVGDVELWLTNSNITSNGTIFEYIGSAPMRDQHFDWPIAPCLTDRTDYSILLHWENSGASLEDANTIGFEIDGSHAPEMTITNPTAATPTWTAGSTQTITWDSITTNGLVDVQLIDDQSLLVVSLGQVPIADSLFNWEICPAIPAGTYQIRLIMSACYASATSDYFAIDGSAPATLEFNPPSSQDPWPAGSSQTVTWNSNNLAGLVDLYLPDNANTHWAKVSVPVTDGSYTWTIPSSLPPGSGYRMDIRSYECGTIVSHDVVSITISEPISLDGDYDHDGDLDLMDLALFQACTTGPGQALLTPPCDVFDFEPDADVDADDLSIILDELTGPITE